MRIALWPPLCGTFAEAHKGLRALALGFLDPLLHQG